MEQLEQVLETLEAALPWPWSVIAGAALALLGCVGAAAVRRRRGPRRRR